MTGLLFHFYCYFKCISFLHYVPIFVGEPALSLSVSHLSDHDFKKGETLYFVCASIFHTCKQGVVVGIKSEGTSVSAKFIDWIVPGGLQYTVI